MWPVIEKKVAVEKLTSGPSYPTSNQKKKNWDKLDHDLNIEFEKEKPEGDEALNKLF